MTGKNHEGEADFRVEDGSESSAGPSQTGFVGNVILENPESETRWYFRYFLGNAHQNFLAYLRTKEKGSNEHVMLSIYTDNVGAIRAILWRKSGSEHLLTNGQRGKLPDAKKVLTAFGHGMPEGRVIEVKDPSLQNDLLVVEEQEGAVKFKIGVLYAQGGQATDDEMFSNEHGSDGFEDFYSVLGETKPLLGFEGYRGGLDVKNGTTGEKVVHTVEFGKEIVFHVSTLLPYSKENQQQLERKRHLGNDICNIVYQEDPGTEFNPNLFKSNFVHIFAVVYPMGLAGYRLKVFTRNTVPEYGPPLPNPCYFPTLDDLRHFLVVKLLNGEKAALSSPVSSFARKKERTLEMLIQNMHSKHDKARKSTLTRGSPRGNKGQRTEDFRSKGQLLKVTKIAAGVAPTSSMSTKQQGEAGSPWTPVCITSTLEHDVISGDTWGDYFLIGSADGLAKLTVAVHESGMLAIERISDSSVLAVQMNADVGSDMIFFRTVARMDDAEDQGRSGMMYAVSMDDMNHLDEPLNKKTIKAYAIPGSKGCHLYALNETTTSTAAMLRKTCKLAVAVGKKIKTYQFLAKNPGKQPGMGSGGLFQQLNEYSCGEAAITMRLAESEGTAMIFAGFKSGEFSMVNLDSSKFSMVSVGAHSDVQPISVIEMKEQDETVDFLLCYNNIGVFRDRTGRSSRNYDIRFNSQPLRIASVFPYLLGFTGNSIEVVTAINGSLVKSIAVENCTFLANNTGVFYASRSPDTGKYSLFKMSQDALAGKVASDTTFGAIEPSRSGNVFARRLSNVTLDSLRRPSGTGQNLFGGGETASLNEEPGFAQKQNPLFVDD